MVGSAFAIALCEETLTAGGVEKREVGGGFFMLFNPFPRRMVRVTGQCRSVVAEYIVALDLGLADSVRAPWFPFDFETRSGIKVEVKAAAYLQCQKWRSVEPSGSPARCRCSVPVRR
jgi:hypothetical protein